MAAGSSEIQAILKAMDNGLITFNEAMPKVQEEIYRKILIFQRELSVQGDTITNTVRNVKLLAQLQAEIEQVILQNSSYTGEVEKFVNLYAVINKLNFAYFKAVEKKFKPPKVIEEVRKQSISIVLEGLTESGVNANLTTPIREIITTYVTTGGSYSKLAKELNNYINGYQSDAGPIDGALVKYTKLYATDAINQYSATVNSIITQDLGWEWYRYIGSNITTTRTFCKALTQKQYYHKSELPQIIKGNFAEFKEMKGQIYDKTKLPQGMYEDTNTSNFTQYRGGYNCGHQAYGTPTYLVPKNILQTQIL